MAEGQGRSWMAADGTRIGFRDHPGAEGRVPLLCLHGLTRNGRDFTGLVERIAGRRRVLVPDLRGRGESGHARDPMSYTPATYAADVEGLLASLRIDRVALVGTSLGGIVAMLLSAARPDRFTGVVLNDIGPVIESAGIARIRGYVGRQGSWPTWLHAARHIADGHRAAFPDYGVEDWIAMAKRLCRLSPAGRVVLDYDMRIAEPFRVAEADQLVDLWPALESLRDTPVLLVRGALSDLLSEATAAEMARRLPQLETLTVPRVGHAPTLDEPAAAAAVAAFLDRIA